MRCAEGEPRAKESQTGKEQGKQEKRSRDCMEEQVLGGRTQRGKGAHCRQGERGRDVQRESEEWCIPGTSRSWCHYNREGQMDGYDGLGNNMTIIAGGLVGRTEGKETKGHVDPDQGGTLEVENQWRRLQGTEVDGGSTGGIHAVPQTYREGVCRGRIQWTLGQV